MIGTTLAAALLAVCVVVQVCSTCYTPSGRAYTCNCHMQCLPGT